MAEETNRRPSFDARGNVRALRTRPGAPLADPTRNLGAIDAGRSSLAGSTQEQWDKKFRNTQTGETPSSLAARRNGDVGKALDEISRSQFGFDQQPFKMTLGGDTPSLGSTPLPSIGAPPSIPTAFSSARPLAMIGQQPSAPTIRKFKTPGANWEDMKVPGVGTKRTVQSRYGWGSSYLPT